MDIIWGVKCVEELYKQLYFYLFNRITDSIELLSSGEVDKAAEALISAQQTAEEMYIDKTDDSH